MTLISHKDQDGGRLDFSCGSGVILPLSMGVISKQSLNEEDIKWNTMFAFLGLINPVVTSCKGYAMHYIMICVALHYDMCGLG